MIYLVITALAIYFTYIISWIWGWKKNNVNTPKISENKISLIIPCRNEAKNIDKLFSNLLNQKFVNYKFAKKKYAPYKNIFLFSEKSTKIVYLCF